MSFFGWLGKTRCERTGLDDVIMAGELLTVLACLYGIFFLWIYYKRK